MSDNILGTIYYLDIPKVDRILVCLWLGPQGFLELIVRISFLEITLTFPCLEKKVSIVQFVFTKEFACLFHGHVYYGTFFELDLVLPMMYIVKLVDRDRQTNQVSRDHEYVFNNVD